MGFWHIHAQTPLRTIVAESLFYFHTNLIGFVICLIITRNIALYISFFLVLVIGFFYIAFQRHNSPPLQCAPARRTFCFTEKSNEVS